MKIAQVVCTYPPYKSGIGNSAFNFASTLEKKGFQISTFTPFYRRWRTQLKNIDGKVIRIKPWLEYGNGAFLPSLFWQLNKFDIIILHYPFFGGAEIVWLWKMILGRKKKLIIFNHHLNVARLPFFVKLLAWPSLLISSSLFKKADTIACASIDYVRHGRLAKLYKKYNHKFKEIPFGVDTNFFQPLPRPENNPKPYRLLFVGGLDKAHYFKGVDFLLEALAKINKIDWQLNIVGSGDLENEYKKMAKRLEIAKKVTFLGKINDKDLSSLYQKSHLFILPSINAGEAFGLVLLEAMSSGCPVIATKLPGVRNVFIDGQQGLFAEPKNYTDLKEKISIILKNDKLRIAMAESARSWVIKNYSWEKVGEELLKIL